MKVSIIICTRNRCEDLWKTLQSFRRVQIPTGVQGELVVVNNGSHDDTPGVVESFRASQWHVRHVFEPAGGQAMARNRGLEEAQGEIILFTDDDVRPVEGWVEGMCRPLNEGKADAVAGAIVLAPELERSWMTPLHRAWLAASVRLDPRNPPQMIGANMAFTRKILTRVPRFDPELGPGATGYGDDGLFSFQIKEAGFRLVSCFGFPVVHYFQPIRLERTQWLSAANGHAETQAYLRHHWEHNSMKLVRLRYWKALASLMHFRKRQSKPPPGEGCSLQELRLLVAALTHRKFLVERRRPRKYTRRGLVKLERQEVVVPRSLNDCWPVKS